MLSDDDIRFLVSLFISIPLSYGLRLIPSAVYRHIYSLVFAFAIQAYMYGVGVFCFLVPNLIVYGLIKWHPKKAALGCNIFGLVTLAFLHFYYIIYFYGQWANDLSLYFMCIVCKYSLIGCAAQDGCKKPENLSPEQNKNKISKTPSLLHFLSYVHFLPTAVIGTPFEYSQFSQFMNSEAPYDQLPSPGKKMLADFGESMIILLIYGVHLFVFPLSTVRDPSFVNNSVPFILFFAFFCIQTVTFRYFFAWKIAILSVHASGLSFSGNKDGEQTHDAIITVQPWKLIFTKHPRIKVNNWNMAVQEWLRKSIYQRSPFKDKNLSQLLTFMVSAFWHGFYPGYYLTFFMFFCLIGLSGQLYSDSKKGEATYVKLYRKTGIAGRIILWILGNFFFMISGLYFEIPDVYQSLRILSATYYIPMIPALFIFIPLFMGSRKKSKSKKGSYTGESQASSASSMKDD